jgi:hypothetical protein
VEGEIHGRIKLATNWHAIGHTVSDPSCPPSQEISFLEQHDTPIPSSSILGSSRKFLASTTTLFDLRVISQRINNVLKLLDPAAASQYEELRDTAMEELDYLKAMCTLDKSLWQNRMMLFNLQTPPHHDTKIPPSEWTPLHVAGTFKQGGCLYVHQLKLRLRYLPGDLIFIRGRLLQHSVEKWGPGQRISLVYFTHESVWKFFNHHLSLSNSTPPN